MRDRLLWAALLGAASCGWKNAPFPDPPSASSGAEVRRSNLQIPPKQTFELGGGQPQGFEVRVQNVSRAPIELLTEDGRAIALTPGAMADATFGPGATARLRNGSGRPARLKVVYVQQGTEFLGMRYVEHASTP